MDRADGTVNREPSCATVDIIVKCSAPMDGKISTQDRLVNKMPIVAILALAAVAFAMVYIF